MKYSFINLHSFRLAVTAITLISMFFVNGCSISMKHGDLNQPPQKYTDTINLSKKSEGIDGKVGWGRITLFYIPLVPIYVNGDANELVMKEIGAALKQVGYQVTDVNTENTSNVPTLKCKVDEFWFNNFTWLFPFVPTWGDIKLTTTLVSPTGKTLWSQTFKGHGFSANFFNGYTNAAQDSMTKILNEMVKEFSSDAFHQALTQST